MSEPFYFEELDNGMVLLGQPMSTVSSAALALLVPAGAAHDPQDRAGSGAVLAEWCMRGAGDRDTRQLNEALDTLGCRHDETTQSEHLVLSGAVLGRHLTEVLRIYADIVRRPRLTDETFAPCRSLILQNLQGLDDEPDRKCDLLLRERFYPDPLGRCVFGREQDLHAMSPDGLRRHAGRQFAPQGSILATAGDMEWERVAAACREQFADWEPTKTAPIRTQPAQGGNTHIPKDSAQVHIGIAHKSIPMRDDRYYPARVAEAVLSWGMGSRLFENVREKRGLVYNVSSRYHGLKDHAGMFTYAGTRPAVAQETLDVTIAELRRLSEGLPAAELARAKTQLRSALMMQRESTSARVRSLAGDYYHLGRLRSLEEISNAIEGVTAEDVVEYARAYPPEDPVVVVIGPQPPEIH